MDWNDKNRLEFPFDVDEILSIDVEERKELVSIYVNPVHSTDPHFVLCSIETGRILTVWPYNVIDAEDCIDKHVKEKPKEFYLVTSPIILDPECEGYLENDAEEIFITKLLHRAENEVLNYPGDQIYKVTPVEDY